jgi:hypothetical protein
MDEVQTFTLDNLENVIDNYIKEQNAAMIYWNHGQEQWNYALSSDKELIKREMKNLIKQIKSGKIIHVARGAAVEVKGTHLYPVEMEVENVQCGAYFVVAKRGLIDDLSMTPYFFRSEQKRDEIYDYLMRRAFA